MPPEWPVTARATRQLNPDFCGFVDVLRVWKQVVVIEIVHLAHNLKFGKAAFMYPAVM